VGGSSSRRIELEPTVPRFYFDVHDGVDIRDEIGRELSDRQAVRDEALQSPRSSWLRRPPTRRRRRSF
jgi:hypothetical protein